MLTLVHLQWKNLLRDQEKEAQPKHAKSEQKAIIIGNHANKWAMKVVFIHGKTRNYSASVCFSDRARGARICNAVRVARTCKTLAALTPVTEYREPSLVIKHTAQTSAVTFAAPALRSPLAHTVAPSRALTSGALASVSECVAPSPVTEYRAPSPAVTHVVRARQELCRLLHVSLHH